FGRDVGEMRRDDGARKIWHREYARLSEGRPGLAGDMLARAEAQTMRLACLYALLDSSCLVEAEHLNAALALLDYCERSTRFVFGDSLGDDVADEILAALKQRPEGMTRNDIRQLLGGHQSAPRITRAIGVLARLGLAACADPEPTGGRPAERWFYQEGPARKER